MSEENPTNTALSTSTHPARNRAAQVFSVLLTLTVLGAIGWLIYDVYQLKGYVDILETRLDSAETRFSQIASAISSIESELSVVGALARNADSYAHSHYSDVRMKQNIANLDNALTNTLRLRAVTFNWNTDEFPYMGFSNQTQIGFIAQEVEQVYPELVSIDVNGYKSIDYANLTPVLLEAIKEQQGAINALQQQNAELIERIKTLENVAGVGK